ncbi:amidase [Phyllobacterium sp. 21LDTY02-6]|uniref:amidase n=1 Tax=Phyllobacterium sp. 21LDTY02-6 TaxID=2944903 RepID=UPI002020ADC7|nr:amidase [Phyllobacterium sp. 21LDTY02-6]MCO4318913.1 amidase [Phyllobacterium sp. 21LDTY02-6]
MASTSFDYTQSDAVGLGEAIRNRILSPQEAVQEAFAAIERCNPQLNAVIYEMREQADEQLKTLPEGPLSGVPVLLKDDCPSYAGAAMSFGCRAAQSNISQHDHELVKRYKSAGLVVVGKTNLPEFSCNIATESSLHGPALNPWDVKRSIGGSSGGAAAAVAARMVPVAYGNDGAGSIRIPSSCGGLFGLRPSRGRVPCGPVSTENWGGMVSHHVLTRSVRDSAAMLDLTDTLEPGALYAAPAKKSLFVDSVKTTPRELRIGVWRRSDLREDLDEQSVAALEETIRLCEQLGHIIVPATPDFDGIELANAMQKLIAVYTAIEVADVAATTRKPANDLYFEPSNLGLAAFGEGLSATEVIQARLTANSTARSFGRLFEGCDVVLSPVMPVASFPLGMLDARAPDWEDFVQQFLTLTTFTHPINAAGLPAMSVPLYETPDGFPVGSQFIASYGGENLLFELAGQLEAMCPWSDRLPAIHA